METLLIQIIGYVMGNTRKDGTGYFLTKHTEAGAGKTQASELPIRKSALLP